MRASCPAQRADVTQSRRITLEPSGTITVLTARSGMSQELSGRVASGAPEETGPEQHDTGPEHRAAHPAGDRALLLHFRLEVAELEDALLTRVVGRAQDQKDTRGNEDQAGDQGSSHLPIVAASRLSYLNPYAQRGRIIIYSHLNARAITARSAALCSSIHIRLDISPWTKVRSSSAIRLSNMLKSLRISSSFRPSRRSPR
jgi:hypothetical protein